MIVHSVGWMIIRACYGGWWSVRIVCCVWIIGAKIVKSVSLAQLVPLVVFMDKPSVHSPIGLLSAFSRDLIGDARRWIVDYRQIGSIAIWTADGTVSWAAQIYKAPSADHLPAAARFVHVPRVLCEANGALAKVCDGPFWCS